MVKSMKSSIELEFSRKLSNLLIIIKNKKILNDSVFNTFVLNVLRDLLNQVSHTIDLSYMRTEISEWINYVQQFNVSITPEIRKSNAADLLNKIYDL
jgi:hypothetical protein